MVRLRGNRGCGKGTLHWRKKKVTASGASRRSIRPPARMRATRFLFATRGFFDRVRADGPGRLAARFKFAAESFAPTAVHAARAYKTSHDHSRSFLGKWPVGARPGFASSLLALHPRTFRYLNWR